EGSDLPERGWRARGRARPRSGAPERAVRDLGSAVAHGSGARAKESLMVRKLGNFDDWIDYFRYWQEPIGLPQRDLRSFKFEGKREAAKLLERRADEGERLLGSFNELVDNWLDFFTYTQFIDRDGKFQLTMLSVSGFDPLSRSMNPMLKEESFHLGTGNNGLLRIVKAGKMPPELIQKFFYKWIPTAFDLFGTDNSSSAHWAYVWGLKVRYDERENQSEADK